MDEAAERVELELEALEAIVGEDNFKKLTANSPQVSIQVTVRQGVVLHVSLPAGYPVDQPPKVHLVCDILDQSTALSPLLEDHLTACWDGNEVATSQSNAACSTHSPQNANINAIRYV